MCISKLVKSCESALYVSPWEMPANIFLENYAVYMFNITAELLYVTIEPVKEF
jgi:hypothetical protein